MIYIIGYSGNMARRYRAILDFLNIRHTGHDYGELPKVGFGKASGYIIATPTDDHIDHIRGVIGFGSPILCEKPITKDIEKLMSLEKTTPEVKSLLTMVNQYDHLIGNPKEGISQYNYFKSGSDGLKWDCINIIGLSKYKPLLDNTSPIWTCSINGQHLDIQDMDIAYLRMIQSWVINPRPNWDYIVHSHKKANAYD